MSHITYDQLLELISWKILTKEMKGTCIKDSELEEFLELRDNLKGADHGGIYTGSPGRDIFHFLPYLTDEQTEEVVEKLSQVFPKESSGHHVQTSACIRQIYGLFVREGVLLSSERMEEMINSNLDWSLPRKFLDILRREFKKVKNYYGLCIVYEIDGHRYGDEAIMEKSENKLELMRQSYKKSVKYAFKCNCKKQIFTPYYWGAKYYDRYGDKKKAVEWYLKMMKNFNQKGAKRSGVYFEKLQDAADRVRKLDLKEFRSAYNFYIVNKNIKSNRRPLKKALGRTNDKTFKVSIITTLYNYKGYIIDCIKSFLDQDFLDSEMIIVDDASTDNPYDSIKKYESDRVRYIRLDKNQGYSHAKNVGIQAAKANILIMLDADDMLTKDSISIRYNKLLEGYDFVHGPCLDCKKGKPLVRNRMWDLWKKEKTYKYVHAQGVMLKKDIHKKIGLYDKSLLCKSDREFFARVFNHGFKIGVVEQDVALYRRHTKQMHRSPAKAKINDKLQREVEKKMEVRRTDLSDLEMLL